VEHIDGHLYSVGKWAFRGERRGRERGQVVDWITGMDCCASGLLVGRRNVFAGY
jgi:hypothetical protein